MASKHDDERAAAIVEAFKPLARVNILREIQGDVDRISDKFRKSFSVLATKEVASKLCRAWDAIQQLRKCLKDIEAEEVE
jgi:hypothetical protein